MKAAALGIIAATSLYGSEVTLPEGSLIWQQPGYANSLRFFDEARPAGWISLYGELNGGTLFDFDFVSQQLTWDFSGTRYRLQYIVVNDGDADCKIYSLSNGNMLTGDEVISSFNAPIQTVNLYGRIDEHGATWLLLAIALVPILKRRHV